MTAIIVPADLPIAERRDEVVAAIREHPVLVVAGETGSGKSTQLPKLCLAAGRGQDRWIGHTQPRRIAARTIAERVASELDSEVGGLVGYTVRFHDEVGTDTRIKVMTDGRLLAEIQRDPELARYDTLIIDEAHERSLNIDFLLGYLRRLITRRDDLRVIITSATIDTDRFSAHFDDAPVIEVSGRTYPVDVRYRPPIESESSERVDQTDAITTAVRSLQREGPGDVLVFCSGEREIRDAAQALREAGLADTEILPLYARLSSAEQHRVFQPHHDRRIVLATNVAETSLTVPGIRYVVDPGTARISRYSHRTKVQRLPIEPVSQASADQRAGRCGRIGPGICIRLYDEDDYLGRPRFTDPEIQRTNLASVLLRMAALGLGDIEDFPFLDPPDQRAIRDGVSLLHELGAVDPDRAGTPEWLTPLGRRLADLPVDPRLGRMIVAGGDLDCVHEVLVIAAALSIQDPRERPTGADAPDARRSHSRFAVEGSDLLAYLELWEHLHQLRRGRSGNQFRKQCRAEYLHVLRIREWQDLYTQLRRTASQMGLRRNQERADPDQVHQAILTGLLSHVGRRREESKGRREPSSRRGADRAEYLSTRNGRFALARESSLASSGARWVMAAELVETNRVWARGAAKIRPEWIERTGAHLIERHLENPWWDPERGTTRTIERLTLLGLSIVDGRTIDLAQVDPPLARELFIEHALVDPLFESADDETSSRTGALAALRAENSQRVADVVALGARARRDLLAAPEQLALFFDDRLPQHVMSTRQFERWWSRGRDRDPELLHLPSSVLVDPSAREVDAAAFPDTWDGPSGQLPLSYHFDPMSDDDGVTLEVPVALVPRLVGPDLEWHVPGHRLEVIEALLRQLPKAVRRHLVPIPDTARELLAEIEPQRLSGEGLVDSLADAVGGRLEPGQAGGSLDITALADHLRIGIRAHDPDGRTVAFDRDLGALRERVRARIADALSAATIDMQRDGLVDWPGGTIPRRQAVRLAGHDVDTYPSLVDQVQSVSLRAFPDPDEATDAHWDGTRRLLMLRLPAAARALGRLPTARVRHAIVASPHRSEETWTDDLLRAVFDDLLQSGGGPVRDEDAFERLVDHAREQLGDALRSAWTDAVEILDLWGWITAEVARIDGPGFAPITADIRSQLAGLVYPGMHTAVGTERLPDVVRFLRAIRRRLEVLTDDPERDRRRMVACRRLEADYDELCERLPESPELTELGWLLQEFRVATFAQQLGTARPVSEKRIWTEMAKLASP